MNLGGERGGGAPGRFFGTGCVSTVSLAVMMVRVYFRERVCHLYCEGCTDNL